VTRRPPTKRSEPMFGTCPTAAPFMRDGLRRATDHVAESDALEDVPRLEGDGRCQRRGAPSGAPGRGADTNSTGMSSSTPPRPSRPGRPRTRRVTRKGEAVCKPCRESVVRSLREQTVTVRGSRHSLARSSHHVAFLDRIAFFALSCFFPSRRRRCEPFVGFVLWRFFGTNVSAFRPSRRRASAASRFCA
jgi:hypothetical protein